MTSGSWSSSGDRGGDAVHREEVSMNQQTLTISEDLLNRLAAEAQLRGLSIEQLIEDWEGKESEIRRREEAGRRIKALYQEMEAKYGVMPDSAELIREDRDSR
jgi:ribosome-binding protein aMBF1 (putative translation factor)